MCISIDKIEVTQMDVHSADSRDGEGKAAAVPDSADERQIGVTFDCSN